MWSLYIAIQQFSICIPIINTYHQSLINSSPCIKCTKKWLQLKHVTWYRYLMTFVFIHLLLLENVICVCLNGFLGLKEPNPRNKHHPFMRYMYVMPGCYGRNQHLTAILVVILVVILNLTSCAVLTIVLLAKINSLPP